MRKTMRTMRSKKTRAGNESGFTLIELLIVMLILGILAAIAIPAFFNQKNKANDSEAKSAVKTAQTAMETYSIDKGDYSGATVLSLQAIEPSLVDANLVIGADLAPKIYTLTVTADNTNDTFSIHRDNGTTDYPCTAPGTDRGGCPVGDTWNQG